MEESKYTVEEYIRTYPFLQYVNEDKSRYKHAKDAGYDDPDDLFLIGDSGGFLLNINPEDKFVDTHLFSPMAIAYKKNKNQYTVFKEDSIPYRQLRQQEEYRRKHGFSAPCLIRNGKRVEVRITGAHYNFLNYTLMEQLDEKSIKSTTKASTGSKKYDFSKFIDAQFWTHHVMDFAKRNGFHLIIDKTRRGGFSYIMAADTANTINLQPNKNAINVAINKDYLTDKGGLTDFAINNLRFYETRSLFKRGILSNNAENFRLGFKLPNGTVSPKSWNSAIFSVSALNNPNCAIGKDAICVKVEELSTMDNFDAFMTVTDPAMKTGSYTTGTLIAWGTATEGNMQIFESNFYSPNFYHFMPFENVWDNDARNEVCGYFKPYCWGLQGQIGDRYAMDKDGNSDVELGLRIAYQERTNKKESAKTFSEYVNYLGQYANKPAESFSSATENIFTSEELMTWEEKLRNDSSFKFHTDGWLFEKDGKTEFRPNARIEAEGGRLNVDYWDWIEGVPIKAHEDHHGCIRVWFNPIKTKYKEKNGETCFGTPPGLYSISYDPVGVNKDKNEITNKHSHNSIRVWMNPTIYNGFKTACVAAYYGRPEKLIEADRVCYLLAKHYNCIGTVGVEVNRGETISNFTKWKALKYIMKDPVQIWDTSLKSQVSSSYGVVIGDGPRKLEGLRLLKEMLYSEIGQDELGRPKRVFETIYDYQAILELKKWNNVGNFDRVSEMIIRALQWKLTDVEAAREMVTRKKVVDDNNKNILNREWY